MEFKEGDEVVMKSGGPRMVVVEVKPDGWVRCEWMDKNVRQSQDFKATSLKLYNPPQAQVIWLGRP
jgi:uncharacterized protein YodC (DUF2158 family)